MAVVLFHSSNSYYLVSLHLKVLNIIQLAHSKWHRGAQNSFIVFISICYVRMNLKLQDRAIFPRYYLNFVRRPVQNKLNSHYIVPNAGQMPFHNASFDSQIPLLNNLKNEFWVILGCFLMLWFEQFYIHHNLEYRLIRDPRIRHCFYVWLFPCMGVNTCKCLPWRNS